MRPRQIEESYISAEEFCRAAKQDASVVLRTEVGVLQALHFDLVVHSPYRALVGLLKVRGTFAPCHGAKHPGGWGM